MSDAGPVDVLEHLAVLELIARLLTGHDPAEALAAVRFPLDDGPAERYHDHR